MVGVAFDYTDATSRLDGGAGKTSVLAYQFGVYGAWNPSNFFAQGLLSYGTQSLTNTRTGVLAGDLTSNSNGRNAAAAAKFGYLFDAGAVRVGPIAGLTYASNRINGYTENGDAALSLAVGSQNVEALVGSAGLQVRFPFAVGRQIVSPYVNITAENDFKGNGRSIQYSAMSAPLIVNTWNIDSTPSSSVAGPRWPQATSYVRTSRCSDFGAWRLFCRPFFLPRARLRHSRCARSCQRSRGLP